VPAGSQAEIRKARLVRLMARALRFLGCLAGLALVGYGYDVLALQCQAPMDQAALLVGAIALGVMFGCVAIIQVLVVKP